MAFMEINFFSDVLGSCMSMNVIIPQRTQGNIGISEGEVKDTYPTLYLLHGMSDDHTTWMRRTSIERYAEEHGIAVVMPTTFKGWYTDMKYGKKFRTFIGEELPGICRKLFPKMSALREDTYVAGNSMGGYGALAIALTYPETFSIAAPLSACFDPKVLYKPEDPADHYFLDLFGEIGAFDGSKNDLFYLSSLRAGDGSKMPSMYISCGTEDGLIGQNRRMQEHLRQLDYDMLYAEKPGRHNWALWDQEIQNVLDYIDSKRKEN